MRCAALLAGAFALAAPLAAQAPRPGLPEATVPPPLVVTSAADRTTAAVGEPVTLVYSARVPDGAELRLSVIGSDRLQVCAKIGPRQCLLPARICASWAAAACF